MQSDFRLVSGIAAAFCVFTLILVYFIPESPTWLISRGRTDDARKALATIRAIKSNGTVENCFSYFPINFRSNAFYRIILECLIKCRNGAVARTNRIAKQQLAGARWAVECFKATRNLQAIGHYQCVLRFPAVLRHIRHHRLRNPVRRGGRCGH